MIKRTGKILNKFDLFGQILTFEEDDSPLFRTAIGSIFSYLILIFVLVAGFIFGQEIYKRETPAVVAGKDLAVGENSKVNLKDFPIMISIYSEYGGGFDVDIRSLFNLEIWYDSFDDEGNPISESQYGLQECKLEYFDEKFHSQMEDLLTFSKENGRMTYCLIGEGKEEFAWNYVLHFSWVCYDSDIGSSTIFIKISECDEDYRYYMFYENKEAEVYLTAPSCDENRKEILERYTINIIYINSLYDFKNNSNPQKTYISSFSRLLGYGKFYNFNLDVEIDMLITDNGWLLESNEERVTFGLNNIGFSETPITYGSDFANILIVSQDIMNKNYRSYLKVQELFAKVGGLFNAFYLIMKLVLYEYVRFKFRVNYAEYTIDAVDLEKNKNLFPEIDNYKKSYFNMIKKSNSKLISIKIEDKDKDKDKAANIKTNSNNYEDTYKTLNNNIINTTKNNNFINTKSLNNQLNSINPLVSKDEYNSSNNNIINKIKTNNFMKEIDKGNENIDFKKTTDDFENKFNTEKSKKDDNCIFKHRNLNRQASNNPISQYISNFKFKEDMNLKALNDYLIEKVHKTNFFVYLFSDFCGCCYKNKPLSSQIINSEYSRIKYSFKYFLRENKKFKCFQRNMLNINDSLINN